MHMTEAMRVEPGEATDLLIAQHVMGWGKWRWFDGRGVWDWENPTRDEEEQIHPGDWTPSQPGGLNQAFRAVLVAAKDYVLQEFNLHFSDGVWGAFFPSTPTAFAPTAELAVCRALLANWARKQSGGHE